MYNTALNERHQRIDWLLLLALFGLMVMGVAFIYSATTVPESGGDLPWYRQRYFMQAVYYGAGLIAAGVVCLIDYHILCRWSLLIYWLIILLLILVLIPGIGAVRYGARRWIDLGLFQFQPSEFAKLAFLFAQAHFLSRPMEELRHLNVFFKALGLTILPFALVIQEPDLGSALMFLPVGLVMMYVAGISTKYLKRLVIGTASVVALMIVNILFAPPDWQIQLEDYQRNRLLVYFGLEESYNVRQSLISVGSGGLTGKGWQQGTQYALGYLPKGVAHNDFIFSVIAEEKGFLGSVMVVTLYTVVLFCGIRIAGQARDRLGKLLAVGVVTLLFSHVFINIGMNIRIMPVTGIPLPLLSAGGSSVVCSLIAIGILQNVYIYRKSY